VEECDGKKRTQNSNQKPALGKEKMAKE